jgi:hypothetical protein
MHLINLRSRAYTVLTNAHGDVVSLFAKGRTVHPLAASALYSVTPMATGSAVSTIRIAGLPVQTTGYGMRAKRPPEFLLFCHTYALNLQKRPCGGQGCHNSNCTTISTFEIYP